MNELIEKKKKKKRYDATVIFPLKWIQRYRYSERKIILTGFVWRAVGVAKLWELLLFGTLVGVPVLLLLLLLLLTLLFPTPWNPLDTSSMLGVTGGREGGGLQGGTACGSDARPLFVPWLGDLHILSYTFDFSDNANDCG